MPNELMPLEEKIERAMHSMAEMMSSAATARAEAENLEERLKQRRAVLFVKYKADGQAAGAAEQMARADPAYEEVAAEWMVANLKYRRLDAEAEARKLQFEAWRTLNANKRALANMR